MYYYRSYRRRARGPGLVSHYYRSWYYYRSYRSLRRRRPRLSLPLVLLHGVIPQQRLHVRPRVQGVGLLLLHRERLSP